MNGPTRSSTFERRPPVRQESGRAPDDLLSDLDRFVDSEPVAWTPPRRPARAPVPPSDDDDGLDRTLHGPTFGRAAANGDTRVTDALEDADAAFSTEPASPRRDAFMKRLDEELARRPERKATESEPLSPEPAAVATADSALAPPASQSVAAASPSLATPTLKRPSEGERSQGERNGGEVARQPALAEPQDALDWELDNAIGAIIASGRAAEGEGAISSGRAGDGERAAAAAALPALPIPSAQPLPPSTVVAERPGIPAAGRGSAAAEPAAVEPVRPAAPPGSPATPVGGPRRQKLVPTFRFERRAEPDEPAPVIARDADDPLADVFFDDVREAFDAVRPDGRDGDAIDALSDLDVEDYDPPSDDEDELPPSLRRAATPVRQRRRLWPSAGIAAAVIGVAGAAVAAVIGMNVFAGPGGSAANPPVIRADARDVKTLPEDGTDAEVAVARPDIAERTALGDSDRLVLPDEVTIAARDPETPPEDELVSRRVRTVVVRPDGTIVPAEPGGGEASPAATVPAEAVASVADAAAPSTETDGDFPADGEFPVDVAGLDPAEVAVGAGAPNATERGAPTESAVGAVLPRPRPAVPATVRRNAPAPTETAARAASDEPLALQDSGAASGGGTSPAPPVTAWDTPASAATDAPWAVQLASQRTREEAEASLRNFRQRYPNLLGGAEPVIVAADVAERGTFYRVRLPASSRGEAATLCERLKAAGADCFVGRM